MFLNLSAGIEPDAELYNFGSTRGSMHNGIRIEEKHVENDVYTVIVMPFPFA